MFRKIYSLVIFVLCMAVCCDSDIVKEDAMNKVTKRKPQNLNEQLLYIYMAYLYLEEDRSFKL